MMVLDLGHHRVLLLTEKRVVLKQGGGYWDLRDWDTGTALPLTRLSSSQKILHLPSSVSSH